MTPETIAWTCVFVEAVVLMIDTRIIRRLWRERDAARAVAESLSERVQKQSDILSRRAEKPPAPWYDWRHRPPMVGPYHTLAVTAGDLPEQRADAVARLRAAEPRREGP